MRTYTVRSGDTLSKIARKLEVPLDAIIRMNGIANPDRIRLRQMTRHPPVGAEAARYRMVGQAWYRQRK